MQLLLSNIVALTRFVRAPGGLFLFLLFSSCVTQKRCSEKFPAQVSDSIRTWITSECVYIHDTIPQVVLLFDTTGIIPQSVTFSEKKTKGHLTQTVTIQKGRLTAMCNEAAYIDSLKTERKTFHEKDSRVKVLPGEPVRDNWYQFFKWDSIIVDILLLIVIVGLILVKEK